MTIDWTAISTIIEIIGLITIVLSLFYVARQVQQNTNALLTTSRQGLLDSDLELFSDYMTYSIDPHLISDDVELTPEDERRFVWLLYKIIRIREFAWHQYKSKSLDEKTWQSYLAPLPEMFSTRRARAVLNFYNGSQEFKGVLIGLLPAETAPIRQAKLDLIQSLNFNQSARAGATDEKSAK